IINKNDDDDDGIERNTFIFQNENNGNLIGKSQPPLKNSISSSLLTSSQVIGGYPEGYTNAQLLELDTEGRGIVLDFGMFVLFNLYCPHETDETRLPFKMAYYELLEKRVRSLI